MDLDLLKESGKHRAFMPRRRFRKLARDNIQGVTRPAIRRLARRGGVYRIGNEIYEEARRALKDRLTEIIRRIVHVMDSGTTPGHERKVSFPLFMSSHL
ncbi:uncharacterized protein BO95DRAFT_464922 [Aspergillus brunneoviolaceus CBS 621.78]|uniref:Uncharacterized protein n=1 Tax=Aspergillus brunneoviolaceus CBS 621.78 TaxID=1450534 RepID=A0ACD1G582_9EURO|nr:hypothetical protein BO95DRAFT_464922 [Aspergillus brunneoviolaceus CBS 621.78]RAH44427.1 hypothetical protein BO95DRAFT_464922 [Aspergillus brunneoviolaceus CBS 621.78]